MKRIGRMALDFKRRLKTGVYTKVAARAKVAHLRGAMGRSWETDAYLQSVASRFHLSPEEVLRRGIAMFEIAADADAKGNTVAVLNGDRVLREFNEFRTPAPGLDGPTPPPSA